MRELVPLLRYPCCSLRFVVVIAPARLLSEQAYYDLTGRSRLAVERGKGETATCRPQTLDAPVLHTEAGSGTGNRKGKIRDLCERDHGLTGSTNEGFRNRKRGRWQLVERTGST